LNVEARSDEIVYQARLGRIVPFFSDDKNAALPEERNRIALDLHDDAADRRRVEPLQKRSSRRNAADRLVRDVRLQGCPQDHRCRHHPQYRQLLVAHFRTPWL
jgi:hypothetical protein